jgi:lysozyme
VKLSKLEDQLIAHEGMVLDIYKDTVGIWTIGVGRNLEHVGLRSEAEARFLLRSDIVAIRSELERAIPWLSDLDEVRQRVLLDMAFNMGVAGLMKFTKTLGLVANGKLSEAAQEMLLSKWTNQVGQRAHTLSKMMATGKDE